MAAFIKGEIRSEAAWQYCFLWRLDDAFRNVVLTGKWMGLLKTKNDEMYVRACIVYLCVCFDSFLFSVLQRQKMVRFFFTSANLFHRFSLFYFQDLIYQSSLVRGNRKKTVQELFCFFLST